MSFINTIYTQRINELMRLTQNHTTEYILD